MKVFFPFFSIFFFFFVVESVPCNRDLFITRRQNLKKMNFVTCVLLT